MKFLVLALLGFFIAYSYDRGEDIEVRRGGDYGEKPDKPDEGKKKFDDIKSLVDETCNKCHNGSTHPVKFDSYEAYKKPNVKTRIENDTMPPGGGLSDEVKGRLLSVW